MKNRIAIIGGSEVSSKIPVIKTLLTKVDTILIGGAMAYTFLRVKGFKIGNSYIENDQTNICREVLDSAEKNGVKILLPIDHIAAVTIQADVTVRMTKINEEIPETMMGLDIGMETVKLFCNEIKKANLIVWNGSMGEFEVELFSGGTTEIAKAISDSNAASVICSDDSISIINKLGLSDKTTHISREGGAYHEYMSDKTVPSID